MAVPRCQLVLQYADSPLVVAKLVRTRGRFAESIDGVAIAGGRKTLAELLRYKGAIMLEGNDVASGLKWALLSNSVVLMPPPTFTSFVLEELFVPWMHYALHTSIA